MVFLIDLQTQFVNHIEISLNVVMDIQKRLSSLICFYWRVLLKDCAVAFAGFFTESPKLHYSIGTHSNSPPVVKLHKTC